MLCCYITYQFYKSHALTGTPKTLTLCFWHKSWVQRRQRTNLNEFITVRTTTRRRQNPNHRPGASPHPLHILPSQPQHSPYLTPISEYPTVPRQNLPRPLQNPNQRRLSSGDLASHPTAVEPTMNTTQWSEPLAGDSQWIFVPVSRRSLETT